MTKALQIGDVYDGRSYISDLPTEIIPFLASYNLIGQFLSQSIIESAMSTTGYANAPITCTQAEISHALKQFYQHWDLTTEQKIQDWCLRYCLTEKQLELFVTRKLRFEKFKQITWGHQLESYFLKRKRYLDQVIYSLIRTENRGIANELFFRITEGEQSFAELAREYSQGTEANTNGIIRLSGTWYYHSQFCQVTLYKASGYSSTTLTLWRIMDNFTCGKVYNCTVGQFYAPTITARKF
ncbi:peptidylprolyl isomerase [Nostoc sp. GT001]|uniref:peptidylprolyl isomerase n=1 Tax=Nostoc sp. GT001 TaxID=3056647 RepID=UPI0025AB1B1C|nr:peptidylprolyl isomerase [Nostoc sp. GT001]MDM9583570.1 peptidylprolyl isomerase [Nostoc sp. GT001]